MSDQSLDSFTSQDWNPEEIESTILSFREIQGELNYKQAQDSLRDLVSSLDLSAREQAGLEAEISHLSQMLDKLEQSVLQIAAFGMVGQGKSSVLNALLGQEIFATGPLHGVTRTAISADWNLGEASLTSTPEKIGASGKDVWRVSLTGEGNCQVQLIDTPGIDEVDGETREALARQIAKQADLILFVVAGDITQVEYRALSRLREVGKPMLLVFNKIDRYPQADRELIYRKIRDERVKELISPEEIVMVAASPLLTQVKQQPDGSRKVVRCRSQPLIEPLKLKILEILHREGKSLVALNTMLYANEVNEQLVQRKMEIRDRAANELINKAVMTKAVAVALNPVTVLDLFTGAVIDVAMILALSRLYGITMTQGAAIALLQRIAMSMGGLSISDFLASLGLSSLKGLLGISAPVTGGVSLTPYAAVAITQAGVAGVFCYSIGQVTKAYLANGASWGPQGPKVVVKKILDSLDETSILNRIKHELSTKLVS